MLLANRGYNIVIGGRDWWDTGCLMHTQGGGGGGVFFGGAKLAEAFF